MDEKKRLCDVWQSASRRLVEALALRGPAGCNITDPG